MVETLSGSEARGGSHTRGGGRRSHGDRRVQGRIALLVEALIALPFASLATHFVVSTDSARLLASIAYVRKTGVGWLVDSQEVLLPHLVLAPIIEIGGIAGARVFSVVALIATAALVAHIAARLSFSLLAAAAAAAALLTFPAIIDQVPDLPMYLPMLCFGYAGAWLAYLAMGDGTSARWPRTIGAGACYVLAAESHGVGQLFLAVPLLLLIVYPSRRSLGPLLRIYAVALLLFLPRIVISLSEGGLTHVRSVRDDYWVTQGYLARINAEFFGHSTDRLGYLREMVGQVVDAVGLTGLPAVVLALVAVALARSRVRLFALACTALLVASLLIVLPPPFPRYLTPLIPGAAIAAGVAVARLRESGARSRALAIAAVVALAAALVASYVPTLRVNEFQRTNLRTLRPVAAAIDDGRGVLGVRGTVLNLVDPDLLTYGALFLSEDEYATFLSWPSDEEVIGMMKARDIGWIVLAPPTERNLERETDYNNVWLVPNHGARVRFREAVMRSPRFCLRLAENGWKLYRLGPCASGAR